MNKYTVHMFRPTERTHNETLTLHTPVKIVVSFRLGHQNGFAMLAREMVARNLPDGHFVVSDPQHPVDPTNKLMDWRTVHEYALLPVGEDPHAVWVARNATNADATEGEAEKTSAKRERKAGLTMASYEALGKLMRNSSEWKAIGGYTKGALLADNYVEMFEGRAVVTDAGRAAHRAFVPDVESSLSVHQQAAFELLPVAEQEWREKVPKATRGVMNREGWVIIRNGMVYPTKAAPEGFGDNAPEFEPDPTPAITDIVSVSVAAAKTERMKPLSENWRTVLEHVQRGMAARTWEAFHGKTKKGLTVTHKAVVLNENGKPILTEIGLRAIETGKIPEAA